MHGLEKSTIDGYNEYVNNLRKEKNTKLTLVLFDHEYIVPVDDKPIKDTPKLNNELYQPRGSTALLDAVCRTINERKNNVKKTDKALVVIITDGLENASHEYKTKDMQDLVHGLEKKGNWVFTYLGANQDAWSVAQAWGFQAGNVASYNATDLGTQSVYMASSASSLNFIRSGKTTTDTFFSEEQKTNLKKTK
jgi:hypothetical protein